MKARVFVSSVPLLVPPAVKAQLNERQKKMAALLVQGHSFTSRACEKKFKITRDTATRDFSLLMNLGLARRQGRGRSTHYVMAART